MIAIRRAGERGRGEHGWLDTRHTFSFGDYYDPGHMGFRALRVMNEDWIAAGRGFGMHGHRDMEILTYVLEGALQHRDSLGNGSVLRPGELQRMTAGTGIRHSEFNPSDSEPVHLYQIWLLPDREGHAPGYDQRAFPAEGRRDRLRVVASPDSRDGSLAIHQDAVVLLGTLDDRVAVSRPIAPGRHAWVQVLRGSIRLGEETLAEGDGAALGGETSIDLVALGPAEVMVFDLP